jgi:apolipoprotein N-acyltransferase
VVIVTQGNKIVSTLIANAVATGPQDPLTVTARNANMILGMLLFPKLLISPIITLALGLLVQISFGILLLPLSIIWMAFLAILLGTSWLWIRHWHLRPFLLVPGVLIAVLADVYVSFVPDMGEKYQKILKMGLCDSWPYSYLVFEESRNFDAQSMV